MSGRPCLTYPGDPEARPDGKEIEKMATLTSNDMWIAARSMSWGERGNHPAPRRPETTMKFEAVRYSYNRITRRDVREVVGIVEAADARSAHEIAVERFGIGSCEYTRKRSVLVRQK